MNYNEIINNYLSTKDNSFLLELKEAKFDEKSILSLFNLIQKLNNDRVLSSQDEDILNSLVVTIFQNSLLNENEKSVLCADFLSNKFSEKFNITCFKVFETIFSLASPAIKKGNHPNFDFNKLENLSPSESLIFSLFKKQGATIKIDFKDLLKLEINEQKKIIDIGYKYPESASTVLLDKIKEISTEIFIFHFNELFKLGQAYQYNSNNEPLYHILITLDESIDPNNYLISIPEHIFEKTPYKGKTFFEYIKNSYSELIVFFLNSFSKEEKKELLKELLMNEAKYRKNHEYSISHIFFREETLSKLFQSNKNIFNKISNLSINQKKALDIKTLTYLFLYTEQEYYSYRNKKAYASVLELSLLLNQNSYFGKNIKFINALNLLQLNNDEFLSRKISVLNKYNCSQEEYKQYIKDSPDYFYGYHLIMSNLLTEENYKLILDILASYETIKELKQYTPFFNKNSEINNEPAVLPYQVDNLYCFEKEYKDFIKDNKDIIPIVKNDDDKFFSSSEIEEISNLLLIDDLSSFTEDDLTHLFEFKNTLLENPDNSTDYEETYDNSTDYEETYENSEDIGLLEESTDKKTEEHIQDVQEVSNTNEINVNFLFSCLKDVKNHINDSTKIANNSYEEQEKIFQLMLSDLHDTKEFFTLLVVDDEAFLKLTQINENIFLSKKEIINIRNDLNEYKKLLIKDLFDSFSNDFEELSINARLENKFYICENMSFEQILLQYFYFKDLNIDFNLIYNKELTLEENYLNILFFLEDKNNASFEHYKTQYYGDKDIYSELFKNRINSINAILESKPVILNNILNTEFDYETAKLNKEDFEKEENYLKEGKAKIDEYRQIKKFQTIEKNIVLDDALNSFIYSNKSVINTINPIYRNLSDFNIINSTYKDDDLSVSFEEFCFIFDNSIIKPINNISQFYLTNSIVNNLKDGFFKFKRATSNLNLEGYITLAFSQDKENHFYENHIHKQLNFKSAYAHNFLNTTIKIQKYLKLMTLNYAKEQEIGLKIFNLVVNLSYFQKVLLNNFLIYKNICIYNKFNCFTNTVLELSKRISSERLIDEKFNNELFSNLNLQTFNKIENQEENLAPETVLLYTDEQRNEYLRYTEDSTNDIHKLWNKKIQKSFAQERAVAKADHLLSEIHNLYYNFPHFKEVIEHIENMMVLQNKGNNFFHIPPLLIVGGAGIGKTFFMHQLASLVKTHLRVVNTQTISANFILMGSNATWSSADTGIIFNSLTMTQEGTINPIILLDELEKAGGDDRYDVKNSLLPVLEGFTAKHFQDECVPVTIDASHISWFATANSTRGLSSPLLSRFDVFYVPNPTVEQRKIIAQNVYTSILKSKSWGHYFIPKLKDETLELLAKLLNEGAARDLKRTLVTACSKAIRLDCKEILPIHIKTDDELNAIEEEEDLLNTEILNLYTDKSRLAFIEDNRGATDSQKHLWADRISEGFSQKLKVASSDTLLNKIDQLYNNFPHFEQAIVHIENMMRLQNKGSKRFFIPPAVLVGGAGVGKTFFVNTLCDLAETSFESVSVQNITGNFVLTGSNGVWKGSEPGLVFKSLFLSKKKTINPVILLDEIEKGRGDSQYDVKNALLPLLERYTAAKFKDECVPIEIDASHISWLATANSINGMSSPLLSRFDIFKIPTPSMEQREKLVLNIYKIILESNSWGSSFNQNLPSDTLRLLAMQFGEGAARDLRKSITTACAKATFTGHNEIRPEHLDIKENKILMPWDM